MTALIETMRAVQGGFPLGPRHRRRVARSAEALGIPWDPSAFPSPERDGVVRLEVNPGGVTITHRPWRDTGPRSVVTSTYVHPGYPFKTTDRAAFDQARAASQRTGAGDALLLTADGVVAEGATWTVYWWDDDVLCTPSLEVGVLPGVAREVVIETASTLGIEVETGHFLRAALDGKAVFCSNAVTGIVPVSCLDGITVPTDRRTHQLADCFWPHP